MILKLYKKIKIGKPKEYLKNIYNCWKK